MKRLLRFWPAALLILLAGAMIAVAILAPKQEEKPKTVLQNTSSEDDDPTEVTLSSEQFSQIQSSLPGFVETTDEQDEESSSDTDSVTSESSEASDTETSDTSSAGTTSSDTGSSDTGSSDETEDDDWILDALYADPTLMHNKLSYDLWAEIGGDTNPDALLAGPDCEYVEVFLNGQYHGVHLLVEPVDEKQTGVEKPDANEDGSHGLLIKTTNWDFTKFNEYSGSPYSNGKWATLWKGFEFKCPKSSLTESDWKPILDLLDASVNGTDEEFAKVASKYLDKENMVNYWIFLSVTLARDNAGKNIYWSMANSSVSGSKLYINVWDCDNSFGYRYGKPPVKDPATTANYADKWFVLLRRYLECNVDGAADYLQDRWEELTKNNGLCSVNGLLDRINAEAELLNISGAFAREQARWPKTSSYHGSCPNPLSVEMEYITEWVSDRIPIVDQLVDNYK